MGRAPCCDKANVKKGPWSPEEDAKLKDFIHKYGSAGNWIALPQKAGLKRCGKSCRLRWLNYLRPNIKHGEFSDEEDRIICTLYASIGSRWSIIASQLPGRTDNDIKNYWNTKLKKKILGFLHQPTTKLTPPFSFLLQTAIPEPQSLSSSTKMAAAPPQDYFLHSDTHSLHHGGYYPMEDNMLVFGATEAAASCPSSDGSCGQISYDGREVRVKHEEDGFFQGFVENRSSFLVEESFESVRDDDQKLRNGIVGSSQLQYDLEEVKQLVTSGGGVNNSLWFGDGEMGMYYF